MKFNYDEIKEELKKHKYIVFKIDQPSNKYKKILSISETKKNIINLLETKYENYSIKKKTSMFFILIKFSFHTGTKMLQGGPLSITISTLVFHEGSTRLTNGFNYGNIYSYVSCKLWFPKKYLEINGWKNEYLDNILNKLLNKKVKVPRLGINTYNTLFIY